MIEGEAFDAADWELLAELRKRFLGGTAGSADYWSDRRTLELYDGFFAARIGWKWEAVLGELKRRGFRPGAGPLLDWGCGTGIAARCFLRAFPEAGGPVVLHDRSDAAMGFAAKRLAEEAGVGAEDIRRVRAVTVGDVEADTTVLLSHVLSELDDRAVDGVVDGLLRRSGAFIWVEPGTYAESRRLIALRARLLDAFRITGPCPHEGLCGLTAEGMERHWCHSFARPPVEAFTDPVWSAFSKALGIDLRSLPYAYLAMSRDKTVSASASASGETFARLLGRAREAPAGLSVLSCEATGVHERRVRTREAKGLVKALKKGRSGPFFRWNLREGRIVGGGAD
ncbi:MAG: hypothetical protein JJU00_17125 [Opitutales bacterium]|nr:hypothetical protein [Opitutales bacterium]